MYNIPVLQKLLERLNRTYKRLLFSYMLKGILLTLSVLILVGILFAFIAAGLPQQITMRYFLLNAYIVVVGILFVYFVIIPLLKWFGIIPANRHNVIVPVINQRFQPLKDTLTNVIDLLHIPADRIQSKSLLEAAIEEKAKFTNQYPLEKAVSFRPHLRYVFLLLISGAVASGFYLTMQENFQKGFKALFQPGLVMETRALYHYTIQNDSLAVGRGDDLTLKIRFEGANVPSRLYVNSWGNDLLMTKESTRTFSYTFNAINNSISFYFTDKSWKSKEYDIDVLPKPSLNNFRVQANVPDYTGKSDFEKQNTGNLSIPEGSEITWTFTTSNVSRLKFNIGDVDTVLNGNEQRFQYSRTFHKSANYTIGLSNKYFNDSSVIKYNIRVKSDAYPEIVAEQQKDSVSPTLRYFHGNISDDYGFSKLNLVISPENKRNADSVYRIPINPNLSYQDFYFSYNFKDLNQSVNRFTYFFEVYDNDRINGPKSAKSKIFTYEILQEEELDSLQQEKNRQMEQSMKQGMKVAQSLQRKLDELKNQSLNENVSSWERNKLLQDIENKQKKLQNLLNKTKKLSKEKRQTEQINKKKNKELLEKQKKLEKMMDELMTDEMKKLLEEIKKLQEEFNKKNMNKLQQDMEFTYEEMEKQLDKNMELMKKLQVEEQLNKLSDNMKELGEKQEELKKQIEEGNLSDEEIKEQQQKLSEEFKEMEQRLDETNKKNDELEFPYKLSDFKEERNNINQNFKNIQEQTDKPFGKNKLQKMQQNNAGDLKKLGKSIQSMLQKNKQQMTRLNKENLKQILSNLLKFSFDNEENMQKLNNTRTRNPQYVDILKGQKRLENNFEVVKDSLYALSKKSFQLDKPINDEVVKIAKNLNDLIRWLEERKLKQAKNKQHQILTSANNLALFLTEVLDNMRQNSGMGAGSGQPQQGGKQKPSISQMKNLQQGLKKQLQQMKEQMKKSGQGKKMNKQLAKMLSQQEKFQQKLRQMRNQGSTSKEMREILRQIEKMTEEVKNDIIEKEITPETIKRQNNIMTRLLEAEDADRERDIEKKREAKTAKKLPMSNPDSIFPYNKENKAFTEKLKLHRLKLRDFYEKKYKYYLQGIGQ